MNNNSVEYSFMIGQEITDNLFQMMNILQGNESDNNSDEE